MKYITNKNDMPRDEHWVIITFSSIYIPGDQRSRTNPGHGYPASNEPIVKYAAFDDEDEWKEQIAEYHLSGTAYQAMKVTPAKVTTNIEVDIK